MLLGNFLAPGGAPWGCCSYAAGCATLPLRPCFLSAERGLTQVYLRAQVFLRFENTSRWMFEEMSDANVLNDRKVGPRGLQKAPSCLRHGGARLHTRLNVGSWLCQAPWRPVQPAQLRVANMCHVGVALCSAAVL